MGSGGETLMRCVLTVSRQVGGAAVVVSLREQGTGIGLIQVSIVFLLSLDLPQLLNMPRGTEKNSTRGVH